MAKITFDSDTNFDLFVDTLPFRYPMNRCAVDETELTVTFKGDDPSHQLRQLGRQLSGEWEE